MVLHETLGLFSYIFNDDLFLLDFGILLSLTTAEKHAPDEDGDVADYHSQKAGGDSDHDTNENRNNDVHNNALEKAGDAMMLMVMTVWSVRPIWTGSVGTRTAVVTVGLVGRNNFNSWAKVSF